MRTQSSVKQTERIVRQMERLVIILRAFWNLDASPHQVDSVVRQFQYYADLFTQQKVFRADHRDRMVAINNFLIAFCEKYGVISKEAATERLEEMRNLMDDLRADVLLAADSEVLKN